MVWALARRPSDGNRRAPGLARGLKPALTARRARDVRGHSRAPRPEMGEVNLMRRRNRWVPVVWGATLVVLGAQALASDASGGGGGTAEVDQFFGSARTAIPVAAPPFHGLEPKLALSYDSSAGNGLVGVGWSLTGFSFIERASRGHGAPSYGGSDVFLLDGDELVPCAAGSTSPSCTTCPSGATCYSAKIETYERIQLDSSANQFYVWAKNGVKTTYASVHAPAAGQTFRYGIASVVDPHGNTVTYRWWCDGSNDCYPDQISYTGAVITLYREARPDPFLFATGSNPGLKSYRLKTIDVAAAGSRVRTIALSYGTSGSTSRSLLTSVQRFGLDAQVDSTGAVSGGTALPPVTLGWSSGGDGSFGYTNVADPSGWVWNSDAQTITGDFNGDGKTDVTLRYTGGGWGTTPIFFSNGDGTFHYTNAGDPSGGVWNQAGAQTLVGDFDGDGKTDVALRNPSSGWGTTPIFFSNGDGTFRYTNVADPSGWVWNAKGAQTLIGDFDGDGKLDVALRYTGGGWGTTPIFFSNGDGTFRYTNAGDPSGGVWNANGAQTLIGDFDGDGKTDVALRYAGWTTTPIFFSNGDGTFRYSNVADPSGSPGSTWSTWNAGGAQTLIGDFNGDGKTDVALRYKGWGSTPIYFSNGNGTFVYSNVADPSGSVWNASGAETLVGDFNGDGMTDVALRNVGWGSTPIFFSNGNGTFRYSNLGDPSGGVWNASGDANTLFQCTNGNLSVAQVCGGGCQMRPPGYDDYCKGGSGTCPSGNGLYCGNDGMGGDPNTLYQCENGTAVAARVCANGCKIMPPGQNDVCNPDSMVGGCPSGNGLYCGGDAVSGAQTLIGDFNGDGKTDLALRNQRVGWGTTPIFFSSGATVPDLLTTVANGTGGTTSLAYASSSTWTNSNNPPLVQTVIRVTTADGRGGTSTTSYAYSGGLFDRLARRFLGFHYVRRTLDRPNDGCASCAQPYEETTFAQDYGSVSKPQEIRFTDGNGTLLTDRQLSYATNGAALPYQSILTQEWSFEYAPGSSACTAWPCATGKRTRVIHIYDVYDVTKSSPSWTAGFGNETSTLSYGDADVTGDERTTIYTYYPNPTAYLVSEPARTQVFTGTTLLSEEDHCYDLPVSATCDASSWTTPPLRGDGTHTLKWLDRPTSSYVVIKAGYDAYGNVTQKIDALGHGSTTTYDGTYHLFPIQEQNALGQTSSTAWNVAVGAPASRTDVNGKVTSYAYDPLGRPISVTAPLGAVTSTIYCSLSSSSNQCGSVSGANAQYVETDTAAADGSGVLWTRQYLDGNGRTWRTVGKGPGAQSGQPYSSTQNIFADTTFDALGQIAVTQSAGYGAARTPGVYQYHDALGRLVRTVYPGSGTSTSGPSEAVSYGAWVTTRTDELGHQTRTTDDAYGHVILREVWHNGAWAATSYVFDLRGNLVQTTDPAGHVTSYTVDSLGRKLAMTDPDLGTWSWSYDAVGDLVSRRDGNGNVVSWSYDAANRALTKTTSEGTVTWTYDEVRAGYANLGHQTTMIDALGQASHDFDDLGREVHRSRSIGGVSYDFFTAYDAGGRLLGTRYPDGQVVGRDPADGSGVALGYDSAGRLYSVPNVGGGSIVTSTQYDALGNVVSQSYGNGTVTSKSYATGARPWLLGLNTALGATVYQDIVYGRDDSGQITSVTASTSSVPNQALVGWTYTYDDLNRLVTAANTSNTQYSASYSYDVLGNILTSPAGSYSYGSRPHAVTAVGATSYGYDAAGNMTSRGGAAIGHDAENRVTQVGAVAFAYDGEGERLQLIDSDGAITTYLGDDYEISPAGVATKYIGGVARRVGNVTYWIHADHLGSTQLETDAAATPVEAERMKYTPYGGQLQVALATGVAADSRGYTGQRLDPSGLLYLHARYYDPTIGRFISPDTVIPSDDLVGLDRYAYANDNPIMNNDPSGHINVYMGEDGEPAPVYEGATNAAGEDRYQRAVAEGRIAPRPYRPAAKSSAPPPVPRQPPVPLPVQVVRAVGRAALVPVVYLPILARVTPALIYDINVLPNMSHKDRAEILNQSADMLNLGCAALEELCIPALAQSVRAGVEDYQAGETPHYLEIAAAAIPVGRLAIRFGPRVIAAAPKVIRTLTGGRVAAPKVDPAIEAHWEQIREGTEGLMKDVSDWEDRMFGKKFRR
jgi:RHS repeat-associated protein